MLSGEFNKNLDSNNLKAPIFKRDGSVGLVGTASAGNVAKYSTFKPGNINRTAHSPMV